jgi:penicillin-binding protein 2
VGGGFKDQKGLGINKIDYYARLFGFGETLDKGFFAGKKGLIPTPEWKLKTFNGDIWRIGDTYNTSIGQYGFQVTPIQALRATAALANGGTLVEPTLLTRESYEKFGDEYDTDYQKIKISAKDEDHFRIVREGMRLAVTNGTMGVLNLPNIKIAGKTGTAQVGTRNQYINSWAVGFFPYEKPKYAFTILLERAPNHAVAGASPSVRHFFEWLALYRREYIDGKPSKTIPVNAESIATSTTTIPSTDIEITPGALNSASPDYSDIER